MTLFHSSEGLLLYVITPGKEVEAASQAVLYTSWAAIETKTRFTCHQLVIEGRS